MTSHTRSILPVLSFVILLCVWTTGSAQDAKPRPTGSISGHIIINSKGAAGIEVGAIGGDNPNRRVPPAQTKTDSEGFYRLEGLAAGNYQVITFTPQLTAAEANSDFGSMYSSAKGVLLAEGENVTDIDIKLIRGGVITGRVTDGDNKPVVEERILLEPIVEQGQRPPRIPPAYGTMYQTDDRGMYRIYGVSAGRYRVSAGRSGPQLVGAVTGVYQQTYHPDVTDPSRATIIELAEGGEAKDVDIRLGRRDDTYKISGRVVDGETGLPIAGTRIGLVMARGSITMGIGTQTTPDGKFTIDGVTAGRYGVYVPTENGNTDFYSDPVSVEVSDKDVTGVEIKAVHGLTISGSVIGDNIDLKELLKQVPGLRVSANISPPGGMTETTIRSFGYGAVAVDGSFTITGLRPGRAMLAIASPDYTKRPSIVKVSIGGVGLTQGFEIDRGQPVSGIQILVAYGTGAIRGSVTFVGAPLSNYRVQLICRREDTRTFAGGATLDARGHFLMRQLAPGSYNCGVQYVNVIGGPQPRPPAPPPQQSVNVSNGVESELNFVIDLTPKGVTP
jgi:Carboxypeptidase regulatory-like domain